ncbi:zinc finger CCCH domain-containing protein ZFN-like isoform X3 [Lycium ferocissimum]|uniref:zinc finger CCCH domain-containing protein ZFN-like isoform X3 n=1 Tax=Lycium ferocissimum TaxID=112874 RepID=UPI0028159D1A|nr:zinc finger CCCH domain-containing protein ZFN-like isoform X3 [Lycium ferocissimum]
MEISVSQRPPSLSPSIHQDALWQMNLRSRASMESGSYPVREGEPDCSYYIRTGLCRFGLTCRFNHPPNRKLYYLKTGACKFGATCKFHHPRDKAGIAGRVTLNVLGYPFRPNEIECAYYMRTAQCKFGSTCKFHHPEPSNMMASFHNSPVYPPRPPSTIPGQLSYPLSRASFISGARWQGPSSYAPLLLPQAMVPVPGFAYSYLFQGQLGSVSSPEGQQDAAGNSQVYGSSRSSDKATMVSEGMNSSYRASSLPEGYYTVRRENVFPKRVGQPECQFYMKTGDCKFGAVCRFHHPRERLLPPADCLLSPIGLPRRPGEPLCIFYSQYGICKFGPSCKFDHPMRVFTYNISASSSTDDPAVQRLLGSSSGTGALTLTTEGIIEAACTEPRRSSLSEPTKMPPGGNNIDREE